MAREYINPIETEDLSGVSGAAVGADPIWDAKGDLAVGTGANTAVRLSSTGATDGYVLTRASTETTGLKWAVGAAGALASMTDVASTVVSEPAARTAYAGSSTTPRDPGQWRLKFDLATSKWEHRRGVEIDFLDYEPYLDGTEPGHNTAKWNQALKDLEDLGGGRIKMPGGYMQFGLGANGLPAHAWMEGAGWAGSIGSRGLTESQTTNIGTHVYWNQANHFIRGKSYGNKVGATTYTITNVTHSVSSGANGSLATITTSVAHGYSADAEVLIASVAGATGVNGTWRVVSAPTSTTFTIRVGAPGTYTSGGTVVEQEYFEADMTRVSDMTLRGGPNAVGGSYDAIRLRNFPDNTTAAGAHSFNDDVYHWIHHVWVYNWGGRGVYFQGTTSGGETWSRECYVTDSHFILCGKFNSTPVPSVEWATSSDGVGQNLRVELTGNSGSTYIAGCDGIKLGGGNVAIFNSKVWYSRGNGFTLSSARVQCYACEAQDNLGHGFELSGDDPILFGFRSDSNGSKDAGQPGPWYAVYISANLSGGMIQGHVGNRGANGETDYAIGFNSTSNTSRDLVISISLGLDPKPKFCEPTFYAQMGRQYVDGGTRRVMLQSRVTYTSTAGVTVASGLSHRYIYEGQYRFHATLIVGRESTVAPPPALRFQLTEDTGGATGTLTINALSGWALLGASGDAGALWNSLTGSPSATILPAGYGTKHVYEATGVFYIESVRLDATPSPVGVILECAFGSRNDADAASSDVYLEPGSNVVLERIL